MTKVASINAVTAPMYSYVSNRFCNLNFDSKESLFYFAKKTSRELSALLLVLQGTEVDSGFVSDAMELAGDIAFELQMAVEILAESEAK